MHDKRKHALSLRCWQCLPGTGKPVRLTCETVTHLSLMLLGAGKQQEALASLQDVGGKGADRQSLYF